jgi:hypothetical protein
VRSSPGQGAVVWKRGGPEERWVRRVSERLEEVFMAKGRSGYTNSEGGTA